MSEVPLYQARREQLERCDDLEFENEKPMLESGRGCLVVLQIAR